MPEYLCGSRLLIGPTFPVVEPGGEDRETTAAVGDRYYRGVVRDTGIDELVLRHYRGSRAKYETAFQEGCLGSKFSILPFELGEAGSFGEGEFGIRVAAVAVPQVRPCPMPPTPHSIAFG